MPVYTWLKTLVPHARSSRPATDKEKMFLMLMLHIDKRDFFSHIDHYATREYL